MLCTDADVFPRQLTVVDVITTELCVCKDASGRLLEDVPTGRLETVIPRHPPDAVMVVRGSRAGQVSASSRVTQLNGVCWCDL